HARNGFNARATNLPNTTSYAFRFVRNNKPKVPERFSSLRQSDVTTTPDNRHNPNAYTTSTQKTVSPIREAPVRLETNRNKPQTQIAATVIQKRNQRVTLRRAAARNSRLAMGRRSIRRLFDSKPLTFPASTQTSCCRRR